MLYRGLTAAPPQHHLAVGRAHPHPALLPVHVAFITAPPQTPPRVPLTRDQPAAGSPAAGDAECWVVTPLFDCGAGAFSGPRVLLDGSPAHRPLLPPRAGREPVRCAAHQPARGL